MPLLSLQLKNFRQFEHSGFDFHPRRNLITGGNAAGKSTVLESAHFLSLGRPIRSKASEKLIREGSEWLSVMGTVQHRGQNYTVLAQQQGAERLLTINGAPGSKTIESARLLPVSLLSPDSHYEFQRDTKQRRAAIDWVLFHVEQGYQGVWARYQRVLLQRNAALKSGGSMRTISAWDDELAMHGDSIQEFRQEVINKLNPLFRHYCDTLLSGEIAAELEFKAGWDSQFGLKACLSRDSEIDRRSGHTRSGPHRSDLAFLFGNGSDAAQSSHGQKKLLFVALKLAQATLLHRSCGMDCTLLVDDLSAELDTDRLRAVMDSLAEFPGQIILTSIHTDPWASIWQDFRAFHVKHGHLIETQNI
jgi:DNA replication and repair protein RecF